MTSRIDKWRRSRLFPILVDIGNFVLFALRRFYTDRMLQAAGALTYSTLLALVPLMAIAFAIFSAFPTFDIVQAKIQALIFQNLVPEVGEEVQSYLAGFTENTKNLTTVGVIALALSALLLLSTIEATLNRVWCVERSRPIWMRFLIYWAVLTLGPLLLGASFTLTTDVFTVAKQWAADSYTPENFDVSWAILKRPTAALIQSVAIGVLFLLVPARPVRVRDAAIGGFIGGIGFELLKWGFRSYLESGSTYETIYGALAIFPIFLIWLYLSWTVIIIGAVFAASFPDWWRSRQPLVVEDLSPARKLEVAVMLLGVLARQAQKGGALPHDRLADSVSLDARDSIIEALRGAGFLVTTDDDGVSLARDLRRTSVADLAQALGLTLGLRKDEKDAASEKSGGLDLRNDAASLREMLQKLGVAETEILRCPLSEIFEKDQTLGPRHSATQSLSVLRPRTRSSKAGN